MAERIEPLMERASEALAHMDYLECESLCLQALAEAKAADDWDTYARVLLPLQEARRQRRMIAADGTTRLGSDELAGEPTSWPQQLSPGCLAVTHPHTRDDALAAQQAAQQQRKHLELLYVDNAPDAQTWTVRSFDGPDVRCNRPAPPLRDSAEWFLAASESLGDAALEHVTAEPGTRDRVEQLERMLAVVTDHEILHQRLADAARALLRSAAQ